MIIPRRTSVRQREYIECIYMPLLIPTDPRRGKQGPSPFQKQG